MRYAEAIDFLYQLQKFGAVLGLERTRELAALAGNPHERLKFIHVAGTNGKGSTCAMLESIYRQAGYKVGLFTSPHLISFTERIQVNRKPIPEGDVARLTEELERFLDQLSGAPTFFEFVTVMALRYFEEQKVDLVIWETGLGGRLDSTNIVTPIMSVITNIQFDHEKWLGHTLAEIAREKAGIIKPGVPVTTGVESEEAWQVIGETANRLGAPAHRVLYKTKMMTPSLPGAHQLKNAMVAVAAACGAQGLFPIGSERDLQKALLEVTWAGRFDIRGRYILDGAHNPDGARTLRLTLEQTFPGLKPAFIVGILADKDITAMAKEFTGIASRIYTVAVQSDRAADAEVLAKEFRLVAPNLPIDSCSSLAAAIGKCESEERVVITGSLHFLGEAMQFLGLEAGPSGERGLNDWSRK
jgi:dihydrofolate synthase/folylpolyglutamate synthase